MSDLMLDVDEVLVGGERGRRLSAATAVELFAIPVIVVVGFVGYVWWRQTADLDIIETNALGWPTIWQQVGQHIQLTVVSAIIVVVIAIPLGIMLTRPRFRGASPAVIGVANAGQAFPTVGLIVLFFMWFSSTSWFVDIPFKDLGFNTSIIALSLYAILPVLRNTITGLEAVDPTLVEAGLGVGMSNSMVLLRIELPLALPVIMAGVRTALVLLVGTATLATFINGGGLGSTIQTGIALYRMPVLIAGAVLVSLLALLIEWIGRVLELITRPKGI